MTRSDLGLLAAAVPALAGSVLLMRQAGAGTALITQQIAVAVICLGAVALTRRRTPPTTTDPSRPVLAIAATSAVVLLWAPIWLSALAGSVLLMRQAHAGTALLTQQIAVAVVCLGAVALTRRETSPTAHTSRPALAIAAASAVLLLWAPIWLNTLGGPERWLGVGGVRIYVASALLPVLVFVLARLMRQSSATPRWAWGLMPAALWALAVQPDASQATAFALACVLPLWRASAGAGMKTLVVTTLVAGVTWAWWQPDPLLPVSYVEGVLDLAQSAGPVALVAALAVLALPPLTLTRQARALNDPALLSVAIYYLAIDVLAWRQLTPMPLLGFGAGPIVGYALLAAAARRRP